MVNSKFLAITALLGTIIGAGFLGVPYIVMKSGFLIGFIYLLVVGIIITLTTLYLGEIALRTNKTHHLPGYAEKYLGKKGKILMLLATAVGIYSALLAYLIGESQSLSYLFFGSLENAFYFGIGFWAILSILSYYGIKALEEGDFLGVSAVFILIVLITITFASKININNLIYINQANIFAPFGVVLFAYLAFSIIPEIKRILKNKERQIKSVIITAYIAAFLMYSIFTLVVLGFKGLETPQIATLALGKLFVLLGMLTMFTSYLSLSIALMSTFQSDFNMKKRKAWLVTIIIPLLLFIILTLSKLASFTVVLGIGGVLSGGLTAILILLMVKKAKALGNRKPEYKIFYSKLLAIILAIIFIFGVISEVLSIV